MKYYEFVFEVPEESREALSNRLSELGSEGLFEKGLNIHAFFKASVNPDELCSALSAFRDILKTSGLDPDFSFCWSLLPEKDWNESWKAGFKPMEVGENLTIVPSWLESDTARVRLIIDPGMVFGTGHHETTRTCLALIEKFSMDSAGKTFLDIGTGTGILAICAAKLGFSHVTAVDTDPLCIEAAEKNALLNSLDSISFIAGDIHAVSGAFDMITANLLSGILTGIAYEIASGLKPGGTAILSGILTGQEFEVIEAYEKEGLTLNEKLLSGTWVTLVFAGAP